MHGTNVKTKFSSPVYIYIYHTLCLKKLRIYISHRVFYDSYNKYRLVSQKTIAE